MSDIWVAIIIAVAPKVFEKIFDRVLDKYWPSRKALSSKNTDC